MQKTFLSLVFGLAVSPLWALMPMDADPATTQTLHFIQDDAQDYMVSKIYNLKYVQANDVTPFVMGIVMRYNMNSIVNCIEYGANNSQMLTVTCPVKMMPYVDDFIAKVDRNIPLDGKEPGEIIKGTGITRAVYRPLYRSGQALLNVLVNSVIGEGPYGSVYAWDANSNQIYWKDNSSNTSYVFQFLAYLDRPAPQINFTFTLYEVRESTMRDIGIDYLTWKNGPGLNIFQTAFDAFSVTSGGTAAVQALSGPAGGFFFAPQFDASFIRILAQSGDAKVKNVANMTVSNSDTKSYSLYFNPQLQNIIKSNNDQTSVTTSNINTATTLNQVYVQINQPIVNIHYGQSQAGYPSGEAFDVANYTPGAVAKFPGTVFFNYNVQTANVVERNNVGAELIDTTNISSSALISLGKDIIIAQWDAEQDVEQVIGVPWLSDIPILKYLFSTTTTNREKTHLYLTLSVELLDTMRSNFPGFPSGELKKIK
ncbi:MAG: hypothetical protein PHI35_02155 [Victivallaceae bacterium]|nr:hypothetical protein [Victivallaceae bacterium]